MLVSISPEALEQSEASLTHAVEEFQKARELWGNTQPPGAELDSVKILRSQIPVARRLLQNALEYHSQWHRILSVMGAGYTAEGHPATIRYHSQVSLAG